jgi:hypothetical protein
LKKTKQVDNMRFMMPQELQSALRDVLSGEEFQSLCGALETISGHLRDGYSMREIIRDIVSTSERPGSPFHGSPINIIPGVAKANCYPVLIALAAGRRGKNGLPHILDEVRAHMIDCEGKTKVALVFSDCWDASEFDTGHKASFSALAARGAKIVFFVSPWLEGEPSCIGIVPSA